MKPLHSSKQRGFSLIEALVSLVILALGVLGLAAVQARMLVETRTTNARAVAIRLVGELSERIQLNPTGAQPGADPAHSTTVSPYSDTAAAAFTAPDDSSVQAGLDNDCPAASPICSAQQLAAYDVADWRRNRVADALPNGRASIWQISPRQLQVVIAWQANENTKTTLGATSATDVAGQLQISATAEGGQCGSSTGFICHIDFIDIPPAK